MTASRSNRYHSGLRRPVATAVLALAAVTLVALPACSAGKITQTSSQVAAVPGLNFDGGPDAMVQLRNVQVQYDDTAGYPKGGDAPLVVRIFNNLPRPIKLIGASAPDAAQSVRLVGGTAPTPPPIVTPTGTPGATPTTSATPSPGATGTPAPTESAAPTIEPTKPGQEKFSIDIPANSFVLLVPGQGSFLQLTGLTAPLQPGYSVNLTFTFQDFTISNLAVPFGLPNHAVPRGPAVPGEGNE